VKVIESTNFTIWGEFDHLGKSQLLLHFFQFSSRFCGQQTPPMLTSTSEAMTIVFQSDSSISHEGFSATYITFDAAQGIDSLKTFIF
jgi:hypothetical protein